MERYSTGDSRNLASDGNSGHGRLGSGTSQSNKTGNDRKRESPDKEVQTVTDTDDQQIYSDRDTDSVSNRSLLDTRTPGEYSRGHIDGSKNIPVNELRRRIGEIEAGKKVYVICQSCLRSNIATRILEGYGFEAYHFAGGFRFYDAVMNDRALVEHAYSCGMDK